MPNGAPTRIESPRAVQISTGSARGQAPHELVPQARLAHTGAGRDQRRARLGLGGALLEGRLQEEQLVLPCHARGRLPEAPAGLVGGLDLADGHEPALLARHLEPQGPEGDGSGDPGDRAASSPRKRPKIRGIYRLPTCREFGSR